MNTKKEPDTTQNETSVATQETKEVSRLDPEYFKHNANVGLEDISQEDLPMPTLSLIQNNSTIVDEEGRPLPRGKFYHKGNKKTYDEVFCTFLSVKKQDLPDFTDKTITNKTYILLGVIEPDFSPFLLYMKRTGLNAVRNFLGEVKYSRIPMYTLRVRLSSEYIQGDKGNYYKIRMEVAKRREDPNEIVTLENMAKTYGARIGEELSKTQDEEEANIHPAEDIPF